MGPPIRIRTEAGEQSLELEEFEARVRSGEIAGHLPVCFPPVTGEGWVRADALDLFRRLSRRRAIYFSRAFNLGQFPRITAAFIALNTVIFLLMRGQGPIDDDALVRWGAKVAPLILDVGQLWRLITANLLHGNVLHIAFNLFVIFNVGGVLENTYRRLDYGLLLLASALGTTLLSLVAMPQAVTAGASGVAYGLLGGAVVFGIKYRALLPPRYRKILGEATIPTVLVFLYIGFTSSGVDNWAHLGGLLAGAAAALVLKPRLLVESSGRPLRSVLLRMAPFAAVAVALAAGERWIQARPASLEWASDDTFGIEAPLPGTWRRGTDRFGAVAFYNGLPGFGRASFSLQAQMLPGIGPEDAADEYLQRQLMGQERAGAIREVVARPRVAVTVGGLKGQMLQASYVGDGGVRNLRALFLARGDLNYGLVFQWPADYPAYESVVDQITAGIRFFEPKELREARARALVRPDFRTLSALGETLHRLGLFDAARVAYEQALEIRPAHGETLAKLAEVLLVRGEAQVGCERAEASRRVLPESARALEVMSRCLVARGDRTGAARLLRRALELSPGDVRLSRRLKALVSGNLEPGP